MWVRDFGQIDRAQQRNEAQTRDTHNGSVARALQLAREIEASVVSGRFGSYRAAAEAIGLTYAMGKQYRQLLKLPEDIQDSILAGEAEHRSQREMTRLLQLPAGQQLAAYRQLLEEKPDLRKSWSSRPSSGGRARKPPNKPPTPVRVVAYFNPELYLGRHERERKRQAELQHFVDDLNARLLTATRSRKRSAIETEVDRRLRRNDLVSAYEVVLDEVERADGETRFRVELRPIAKEWRRRRLTYGMSVLVAHTALKHSAAELCRLYRSKDRVEKDFQTIKSVTELRPIRHRNTEKVNAHVTLCMLALALERLLERELRGQCSPARALEELATCHLNRFASPSGRAAYVLTELTKKQRKLLKTLRAPHLGDNAHTLKRLDDGLYLPGKPK
jgi:hypothetical protein